MKEDTFIYALMNPETKDVFYVGKSDDPKKRLSNHIMDTKKFFNIPKLNLLIKELLDKGLEPDLLVLEQVKKTEWPEKERLHISQHKERGLPLLNLTEGGKVFGKACINRSASRKSKPIIQYDINGNFIKEWVSIREAARQVNCSKSTIYCSLNTKHKTAIGFYWRFKIGNDFPLIITPAKRKYTSKPIIGTFKNGDKKKWDSIRIAGKELSLNESVISQYIRLKKPYNGIIFEKDLSSPRWQQPFGKLNQKLVNYSYINPSEYSQFNNLSK